ncbi:ATP-dependent helicase HrpB [Parasulfitobacter algicola]|uniref:ATP-dependent helicase HrpB n=1 Tax=Parasulfitobacter algicola TaxID=2614809 RepID=A0ABX2IQ01_9RHOB|nr:ATP-dependent helicase HrpB [Sulfitobacter algicola]NSX54962.1 ATP-dependent helicase HrpB [Sulfitobacter algicola]
MTLPIDAILPKLIKALQHQGRAVLQAPPGAGKTTRVPLAMLDAELCQNRILMLEPRRLATKAAAERMAQTLGEPVGQTVGYRMRGESKVSKHTRIEVVTEGILTRMLQSNPELPGVSAVIFDEFHERSLNADLGLALTWEVREALRDDLMILVMSATLDAEPVAKILGDAPVITSEGRAFPVDIKWLNNPVPKTIWFDTAMADLIVKAANETDGSILAFLPGEGEIRRTQAALADRLPADCMVQPLFGAMDFKIQRAAIAPAKTGRKIVLATAIAETSLTIDGIKVVVDGGKSRRARFDPGSGMSRLITERVTRAEATQRTGRAGRVSAGTCYRLWTKGEEGALQPFPPAEIEAADLTSLVLELAVWGTQPGDLAFLTPPPPGAWAEAQALLHMLGALHDNRITDHGRTLSAIPLHPRLAHMLTHAGKDAAPLAAILADRDPLRRAPTDLSLRLEVLQNPGKFVANRPYQLNRATIERIRQEVTRLQAIAPKARAVSLPCMAALAYPDRVGLRRKGDAPRFVLSGGKGAIMADDDPLAGQRLIIATDLDGDPREAKIRQAIPITDADLRDLFSDRIEWTNVCEWSRRDARVIARQQECLGAIVLDDRIWKDVPDDMVAQAMLDGIRQLSLRLIGPARRFQVRVELLRQGGVQLPDFSDETLIDTIQDWLLPHITGVKTADHWQRFDPLPALRTRLNWAQQQQLDTLAPAHFETPMGRKTPIDYSTTPPSIDVRLQEMFGTKTHPAIANQPLRITLLSPAQRPIQITTDLPGFWANSYADVRKDMRGQYPKHPWPEDPIQAEPTLRAKRRNPASGK